MHTTKPSPLAWVETLIQNFLDTSPENAIGPGTEEKSWDDSVLGWARGDDPVFQEIKADIGEFLWTPEEIFSLTYPNIEVAPEELAVLVWILPQRKETKQDNRKETRYPSDRWAGSRYYGEQANMSLRRHMAEALTKAGYPAVSPMASPLFGWHTSPRHGIASNWSERHAAYGCGLGTFGLSDGLITPWGKAHRLGSVVARLDVSPAKRPYDTHTAYCLYHAKGTCLKCVARCPAGAITEKGHDKEACRRYLDDITSSYLENRLGFDAHACGLCQTGVPCESRIPMKLNK
jgi:epoxyqueuosine reductase